MNNYEIEEIYNMYFKDLFIYAFSICKDYHLTEEVVSETFYRAFITINNEKNSVKYWLLHVCRNIIIDYYRKNKKVSNLDIEIQELKFEDNSFEKIIKEEEKRELFNAILKLSDIYKEVIIMFYFMNLTTKEISKSLNISEGSVRNILYRGRRKLGKILREEKYDF